MNRLIAYSSLLLWLTVCASVAAQTVVKTNVESPESAVNSIQGEVVTENGHPLVGVVVTMRHLTDRLLRTTQTDREGKFMTTGLKPGRYLIAASEPGYVSLQENMNIAPSTSPIRITLIKGGVITGRVVNSNGQPTVGARVRALRVEDPTGRQLPNGSTPFERQTDDRGVYRIFGLPPGAYLVAAGGSSQASIRVNAYDYDRPVFYPSTSVENAIRVRVQPGTETAGVDITYRAEPGHVISGRVVSGLPAKPISVFLTLQSARFATAISVTSKLMDSKNNSFAIYGIPDGEYDLVLRARSETVDAVGIHPVNLKGEDADISVTLSELSSVTGLVILDATPVSCNASKEITSEMILIDAERQDSGNEKEATGPFISNQTQVGLNSQRGFSLTSLRQGRYRILPQLENEGWYVKRIALEPEGTNVGNNGLIVKPSAKLGEVKITLSGGAGSVEGRVTSKENLSEASIHVFLVPAAAELKEEVLRYSETLADAQGNFILKNLAPGNYFLLAEVARREHGRRSITNILDPKVRSELRLFSEKNGKPLQLKACEQVKDFDLPLLHKRN